MISITSRLFHLPRTRRAGYSTMHSDQFRRNRCSDQAAIGSASHRVGMLVLVRIVVHLLMDVDADIGRPCLVDPHGYTVSDGLAAHSPNGDVKFSS